MLTHHSRWAVFTPTPSLTSSMPWTLPRARASLLAATQQPYHRHLLPLELPWLHRCRRGTPHLVPRGAHSLQARQSLLLGRGVGALGSRGTEASGGARRGPIFLRELKPEWLGPAEESGEPRMIRGRDLGQVLAVTLCTSTMMAIVPVGQELLQGSKWRMT